MKGKNWIAAIAAATWMSVACALEAFDIGSMHVERHGEHGSPVILVPGLASGAWVWKDTIAALQGRYRIYAVSFGGFDGRPALPGDGFQRASASLRELIVSQGLAKPVIVGHSLGGTLGLLLAATTPDLVGGVVAADGLPVFPTTENLPASQRPALAERLRAQIANATQAEFEAQQLQYMRRVGVVSEAQAADIARRTSRSDPRVVANFAAAVMALDLRAELSAIRVPVLVIAPYFAPDYAALGLSEDAKRAYYESLLHGVPKLDVATIAPARHFVMLDQPQAFVDVVRRFLDANGP